MYSFFYVFFIKSQNYRHLHFTLTMILMISNIYDIYKKNKNRHCCYFAVFLIYKITDIISLK